MAKPISLSFSGKESHFDHVKLDRSKLYGKRKRVAYDSDGKECSRHSLTADGRLVIKSGMTAQGYFTDEGRWIPNKDLVGMDSTGKPIPLVPSTLGVVQELSTPCLPELLLDLKPTTVYMLDPSELDSALEEQLVKGSIFKFALNYRSDYQAETAFLLKNDQGYFCVVGNPTVSEWCELDKPAVEVYQEDDDADDLDFDMF
mgnify:FL=1